VGEPPLVAAKVVEEEQEVDEEVESEPVATGAVGT